MQQHTPSASQSFGTFSDLDRAGSVHAFHASQSGCLPLSSHSSHHVRGPGGWWLPVPWPWRLPCALTTNMLSEPFAALSMHWLPPCMLSMHESCWFLFFSAYTHFLTCERAISVI